MNSSKRQALGQGRHQIEQGRLLYASGHQQVHRPEDAGDSPMKAARVLPLAKPDPLRRVDEAAQRREGDHQIAHHADGGTEPVAPGGEETHQLAETCPGMAVDAAVELRV